ncbi:class I histocompatibility antigen, F10 alpha chain-like [Pygocentrus nattereri]|uniref:class I histocompatibility antigen, F10 alpha chain-like n=1 Tax=Pygocentrus nattereri TaxID=42514 RepID=UPI001890E2E7|nr:class I histocompatibility antigen, F10 alpha chain-like [Pygocentrus nattereri]
MANISTHSINGSSFPAIKDTYSEHLQTSFSIFLAFHSLRCFYAGITPDVSLPEFSVVGLVDGEQIVYDDSNVKEMIPKNEWIMEVDADNPDYWNMKMQKIQGSLDDMMANLVTVMERFSPTGGLHTVQVIFGCMIMELIEDTTTTVMMEKT